MRFDWLWRIFTRATETLILLVDTSVKAADRQALTVPPCGLYVGFGFLLQVPNPIRKEVPAMALEFLRILIALIIGLALWAGTLGILLSLVFGVFWAVVPSLILTAVSLAAAVLMHEYNHRVIFDSEGRRVAVQAR